MSTQSPIAKIFSCTQSIELSKKIAKNFGAELGNVNFTNYSDGEFQPCLLYTSDAADES